MSRAKISAFLQYVILLFRIKDKTSLLKLIIIIENNIYKCFAYRRKNSKVAFIIEKRISHILIKFSRDNQIFYGKTIHGPLLSMTKQFMAHFVP